jgi:ATP/maltotriose-dependent transcriptional regulator MalT
MSMVRYEPARERCEEAIAVARRAGATLEEAYARITLGLDLAYLGDLDEAERQVREGMRIAGEHEYAEDLARGYISLSEVLRLRGRVEDALAVAREGAREAKRLGVDASFGRSMDANAAEDLVRLGRWEEAQESLAALATVQLSRVGAVMHAATAGHLATARGDFALAREHFAAAWAEGEQGVPPEFVPTLATGPAALALALGEPDEARGHVSRALPLVENSEERLYTSMLFAMAARVEADLAERDRLRDPAAAAEHAAAATRIVDALERRLQGPPAPPPIAVAHLAECRAECTRAAGASAAAAWHDCAERWDDLGFRPSAAYARFRLAEALLAGGAGRADAAAVLRVAARAAEGLGARPLAREIAALAQRARLDLAEPEPAPAAEPRVPEAAARLGLTRRELEVLALVAEGLTNQEIADRLFISVSTAGVHISHILGKLHVRKRLDAATLAHRSGLLPASERSVAS